MLTPSLVKAYLMERRRASLGDVAVHFGSSVDATRQVLDQWLAKGRVRRLAGSGGCAGGGCCSCPTGSDDVYEWVP